ncbi:SAM-dependent methyltransferase [Actinomadura litoris]|uniref:SAM-dependent methyltransferase n=1 Tax=Actinomadura litoris TaxID=2678616 RepID=UPI001FA7B7FF|nr:SAM-dependent methyltransferase [Actinomadura litoris]
MSVPSVQVPDEPPEAVIDTTVPSIARVYDLLLGGKDNYASDRVFAEELAESNPHLGRLVRDNRTFVGRAVRYLVQEAGVRQFLDVGTGLPTADNVHEVAQRARPDARVVYVDNDPVVLTHARALLTSTPQGRTAYIDADAHDAATILDQASRAGLDFDQPAAVLFAAILHFCVDAEAVVTPFRDALAPGSHLVISHAADRPDMAGVAAAYQQAMQVGTLRSPEQIEGLFGGFELVPPGLAALPDWRPDPTGAAGPDRSAAGLFLAGVARKPASAGRGWV